MAERCVDGFTRELIEELDARLREAKRLRNSAERRRCRSPFYPDRRAIGRAADESQDDEESPA